MVSEKEKMMSGKLYYAFDEVLFKERQYAKDLVSQFNACHPREIDRRNGILRKLLGKTKEKLFIEPPFRCDYGYNVEVGENFYANYNLIILDCAKVVIGDNVLIGPNVSLLTAGHPLHHEIRNLECEFAFPIHIGDNVWLGGNVVINPGIKIGDRSVIGSGSVVTRDIPSDVVAVGNPCKVLRKISDKDKMYYKGEIRIK